MRRKISEAIYKLFLWLIYLLMDSEADSWQENLMVRLTAWVLRHEEKYYKIVGES